MPNLTINTSAQLEDDKVTELLGVFSKAVSKVLGKDEKWIMIQINQGQKMCFGGSTDPCA